MPNESNPANPSHFQAPTPATPAAPLAPAFSADPPIPVQWIRAADALGANHPVDVYIKRLRTPVSRETTERKLDMVARAMADLWPGAVQLQHPRGERFGVPWLALTPIACEQLRSDLADRWAPATGNAALAAIRGVLRAAWLAGAFDADQRDRLFAGLSAIRGDVRYVKRDKAGASRARGTRSASSAPSGTGVSSESGKSSPTAADLWAAEDAESAGEPGRHLEPGEIRALWHVASTDRKGARGPRNLAVLALLYGCGMRAGEAVGLSLADLDLGDEPAVRVFGKGRKRRVVPIPPTAVVPLQRWVAARGRERTSGCLLLPVLKNGAILYERAGEPVQLTPQALTGICLALAKQAGIAPFRAHDLRRSFAGQHLDAGTDISTVAALMGHSNVTTTARYDRRPDRARRAAQGRLWVPDASG